LGKLANERKIGMSWAPNVRAMRGYRAIVALAGFAVLGWLTWRSRTALDDVFTRVSPVPFTVACALGVVFTVVQGTLFSLLVRKHSNQHPGISLVAAFLLSQPGKNVPGKIWAPLMQALTLRQTASVGGLAVAYVELAIIGIVQMTALGLAFMTTSSPLLSVIALAAGMTACVAFSMMPTVSWLMRAFPNAVRRMRLPLASGDEHGAKLSTATGLTVLSFATNAVASWYVLRALDGSIPADMHVPILANLYLGFAASLLALPVPAGIGVREAATAGLGAVLTPQISNSLIVSIALFVRCWQLAVDASCFALGALLQWLRRH
jgi:hypothetical protein